MNKSMSKNMEKESDGGLMGMVRPFIQLRSHSS